MGVARDFTLRGVDELFLGRGGARDQDADQEEDELESTHEAHLGSGVSAQNDELFRNQQ